MERKTRVTLIGISIAIISLMLTSQSYARINPETCVGAWLFDENKGDIAKDSSGNKNDGTIKGDPELVEGKFGRGLRFDGMDDYVAVPSSGSLNPKQEITVMAWINSPDVTRRYQMIVTKDDFGTADGQWNLRFEQTNANLNFCANIGGAWINNRGPTKLINDTWYHVAGTYKDGDGQRLYIDGIVDAKNNSSGNLKQDAQEINFGTRQHGHKGYLFQGVMDEVAIFNVALTEDEIMNIITNGLSNTLGISAISTVDKLTTTWARIKAQ